MESEILLDEQPLYGGEHEPAICGVTSSMGDVGCCFSFARRDTFGYSFICGHGKDSVMPRGLLALQISPKRFISHSFNIT